MKTNFEFKNLTELESLEKESKAQLFLNDLYKNQRFLLLVNDSENHGSFSISKSDYDVILVNMMLNHLMRGWEKAIENGVSRQSAIKEASNLFDIFIKKLTTG